MSVQPSPEEQVAAVQAVAQSGLPAQIAIARIDATLLAIKNQIDASERSSEQLVRLVNERFTARFDSLERRLDDMDRSREASRLDQAKAAEKTDTRLIAVEMWQQKISNRIIGIGIGIGIASSSATAVIMKLLEP